MANYTKTTIPSVSDVTRNAIKAKSANALPNDPSANRMKGDTVKKHFYNYVTDSEGASVINEINRINTATQTKIDGLIDKVNENTNTDDSDTFSGKNVVQSLEHLQTQVNTLQGASIDNTGLTTALSAYATTTAVNSTVSESIDKATNDVNLLDQNLFSKLSFSANGNTNCGASFSLYDSGAYTNGITIGNKTTNGTFSSTFTIATDRTFRVLIGINGNVADDKVYFDNFFLKAGTYYARYTISKWTFTSGGTCSYTYSGLQISKYDVPYQEYVGKVSNEKDTLKVALGLGAFDTHVKNGNSATITRSTGYKKNTDFTWTYTSNSNQYTTSIVDSNLAFGVTQMISNYNILTGRVNVNTSYILLYDKKITLSILGFTSASDYDTYFTNNPLEVQYQKTTSTTETSLIDGYINKNIKDLNEKIYSHRHYLYYNTESDSQDRNGIEVYPIYLTSFSRYCSKIVVISTLNDERCQTELYFLPNEQAFISGKPQFPIFNHLGTYMGYIAIEKTTNGGYDSYGVNLQCASGVVGSIYEVIIMKIEDPVF